MTNADRGAPLWRIAVTCNWIALRKQVCPFNGQFLALELLAPSRAQRSLWRVTLAALAILILMASCTPVDVAPLGVESRKSNSTEDEKSFSEAAAELDRAFERSGLFYEDKNLENYLNEVSRKLWKTTDLPVELAARIRIIKHPFLNAFATPDGRIYFHSGLLARLENEAQLAVILGHELTHYIQRHAFKEKRLLEQRTALIKLIQVLAITASAVGGPGPAMLASAATERAGALWTLTAVNGYSRDLENEADTQGFNLLVEAGYDFHEAPRVFELLQEELDSHIHQPYFFATHPKLDQRLENYRKLVAAAKKNSSRNEKGTTNTDSYLESVRQLQLDNVALDLEAGRLQTAKLVLERHLERWPESPQAHFLLGSYLRKSSGTSGVQNLQAIAAYREALRLKPDFPEAARELGLIYRAQSNRTDTLEQFRSYLSLRPDALDAPIIRGYIEELEKVKER